jgi:hypothetical protein
MSKFLNIPNGDYTIKVQPSGVIRLDTGSEQGQVVVTGDLIVEGDTTTVQSEDLAVRDNIIIINDGETGPGITLDTAGIQIDRGSFLDAFFIFDESLTDPVDRVDSDLKPGLFKFELEGGVTKGIYTNSISTGGENLLISTGSGVISVSGTTNYETNVTDDDDITNKKYVDDAISTAFATVLLPQIGEGETTPSRVVVKDIEESSVSESQINFDIDDVNIGNFYSNRFELGNIRIIDTTIETLASNEDLILSAPGTGDVIVDDTLKLNSVPSVIDPNLVPTVPLDGVKIYTGNESTGNTGIYFVNQNETRDEVISRNRALVFSMIF